MDIEDSRHIGSLYMEKKKSCNTNQVDLRYHSEVASYLFLDDSTKNKHYQEYVDNFKVKNIDQNKSSTNPMKWSSFQQPKRLSQREIDISRLKSMRNEIS